MNATLFPCSAFSRLLACCVFDTLTCAAPNAFAFTENLTHRTPLNTFMAVS